MISPSLAIVILPSDLQLDRLSLVVEDMIALLGGENEIAVAVDHESAIAGQVLARTVGDGEIAAALDGDVERVAGGFEVALLGIDARGHGQEPAADVFLQRIAVSRPAALLERGSAFLEEGQVALEADGFGIGNIVGDDVLAIGVGHDAGGGEVEAVVHVRREFSGSQFQMFSIFNFSIFNRAPGIGIRRVKIEN